MGEQAVVLEDDADPPVAGQQPGVLVLEHAVAERHTSRGERREPGERPQQGALAGAVGPEHRDHLARRDREGDVQGEAAHLQPHVGDQAHDDRPGPVHRSRSASSTAMLTASSTRESATAASGSVCSAR